jgi:N6-L-threonylcarbamoyladenine synthase
MITLGIETSCDETAVAIITSQGKVLSHKLNSQIDIHRAFGGVVPEVAARAHVDIIDILIKQALEEAKINPQDIDLYSATSGPGLLGGLMVGSIAAKTMAWCFNKPFVGVNHLVGHALLPTMFEEISFPFLLLLVSGGHTQFLAVLKEDKYELLGQSIDDAIGEAFDKSARLLGLPYPGGVEIQKLATMGNPHKYVLPKPLYKKPNCDFSFSGLKTAVKDLITSLGGQEGLSQTQRYDICASLQYTIAQTVEDRLIKAVSMFEGSHGKLSSLVVSGGVCANTEIRGVLKQYTDTNNIKLHLPPMELCTDNAVMIAWAGLQKYKTQGADGLNFPIRSRWALKDL